MTESEQAFEKYLDEVIIQAGAKGKRRHIWSIPRINMAREVWMECMERQNVASTGKRSEVSSPQVPGRNP